MRQKKTAEVKRRADAAGKPFTEYTESELKEWLSRSYVKHSLYGQGLEPEQPQPKGMSLQC